MLNLNLKIKNQALRILAAITTTVLCSFGIIAVAAWAFTAVGTVAAWAITIASMIAFIFINMTLVGSYGLTEQELTILTRVMDMVGSVLEIASHVRS